MILCRSCTPDGLTLPDVGKGELRLSVQRATHVPRENQMQEGALLVPALEHPMCMWHFEAWAYHRARAHYDKHPDDAPAQMMVPRLAGGGMVDLG